MNQEEYDRKGKEEFTKFIKLMLVGVRVSVLLVVMDILLKIFFPSNLEFNLGLVFAIITTFLVLNWIIAEKQKNGKELKKKT